MKKKNKHPNQPLVYAKDGCMRFKQNDIVRKLLDFAADHGYSINEIYQEFLPSHADDYKQLLQLLGYSIGGYCDISMIPEKQKKRAEKKAEKLRKQKKGE